MLKPYLVQCCLGDGVVLHAEGLLMLGELAEDASQSALCVRELVLQCVVVLLLEHAPGEAILHKLLHGLQSRGRSSHSHDHRVAVPKPA